MKKEQLNLQCPKCSKVWTYKGKSKFYATCPDCKTSVKIMEENIKA